MKIIFKAFDGTEFKSEEECKEHEKKLNMMKRRILNAINIKYYNVHCIIFCGIWDCDLVDNTLFQEVDFEHIR